VTTYGLNCMLGAYQHTAQNGGNSDTNFFPAIVVFGSVFPFWSQLLSFMDIFCRKETWRISGCASGNFCHQESIHACCVSTLCVLTSVFHWSVLGPVEVSCCATTVLQYFKCI
jgi:hypothetical protein